MAHAIIPARFIQIQTLFWRSGLVLANARCRGLKTDGFWRFYSTETVTF
jgi:hypothetical protein